MGGGGGPGGEGVAAGGAVEAVGAPVLLQPGFRGRHVLEAVGAVMGVHLVRDTTAAPDFGAVPAEVEAAQGLRVAATATVADQAEIMILIEGAGDRNFHASRLEADFFDESGC